MLAIEEFLLILSSLLLLTPGELLLILPEELLLILAPEEALLSFPGSSILAAKALKIKPTCHKLYASISVFNQGSIKRSKIFKVFKTG